MTAPKDFVIDADPIRIQRKSERLNYCSEASTQMFLASRGIIVDQDLIHKAAWTYESMEPFLVQYVEVREIKGPDLSDITQAIARDSPVMARIATNGNNRHTVVIYGYEDFGEVLHVIDPDMGIQHLPGHQMAPNIISIMVMDENEPDGVGSRIAQKRHERATKRRRDTAKGKLEERRSDGYSNPQNIKAGDRVKSVFTGETGTVHDLRDGMAQVELDSGKGLVMWNMAWNVEKIEGKPDGKALVWEINWRVPLQNGERLMEELKSNGFRGVGSDAYYANPDDYMVVGCYQEDVGQTEPWYYGRLGEANMIANRWNAHIQYSKYRDDKRYYTFEDEPDGQTQFGNRFGIGESVVNLNTNEQAEVMGSTASGVTVKDFNGKIDHWQFGTFKRA